MLTPWLNAKVKVQRRTGTSRNALNEPDWGDDANYSIIYASVDVRIEIVEHQAEYLETGERIKEVDTLMYFEPTYNIKAMDRITVIGTDDAFGLLNKLVIIQDVHPEWDSVGNVHHYVGTLQVH